MTARISRLARQVHATRQVPVPSLIAIIGNRNFNVMYRLAALRHLIALSPVTRHSGLVYLERKRLVRRHYQV